MYYIQYIKLNTYSLLNCPRGLTRNTEDIRAFEAGIRMGQTLGHVWNGCAKYI